MSVLTDLNMRGIIHSHLGKLAQMNAFYNNGLRRVHSDIFRSVYPKAQKMLARSYDSKGDFSSEIVLSSVSKITFKAYMRDNFDNDLDGGESGFEFSFANMRLGVEITNNGVKFYKGNKAVSREAYIKYMNIANKDHFKHAEKLRKELLRKKLADKLKMKSITFVKNDGGFKQAIEDKKIFPKNKVSGACAVIAFANATGRNIIYWFNRLTEMKRQRGETDASDSNSQKDIDALLQEMGWVPRIGDDRPLHYSNVPKTGTVFLIMYRHATVLKDGVLHDRWDCRNFRVLAYYIKKSDVTRRVRERIKKSVGLTDFYNAKNEKPNNWFYESINARIKRRR